MSNFACVLQLTGSNPARLKFSEESVCLRDKQNVVTFSGDVDTMKKVENLLQEFKIDTEAYSDHLRRAPDQSHARTCD